MTENQQRPKRRWLKFSPWLLVVLIIGAGILIAYYTSSNKSGGPGPSPTVPTEPLQLTDLQAHTFGDLGISISYPLDWEQLQTNNSDSILLGSQNLCMDVPLMIGVFKPVDISSMDLQSAIDYLLSLFIQKTGFTVVSNESITVNGMPMVKVVVSDKSTYSYEAWKVLVFIYNDTKLGNILAYCRADCWEYYEDAVYTIAATYQFLD